MTVESAKQATIGRDTIDVESEKCLHRSWWFECYAADIGFLRGGSLQFYHLSHARIGSRTYGSRDVTSAAHGIAEKLDDAVDVFPNPATSRVDVAFYLQAAGNATLRIVSMTGREVAEVKLGYYSSGQHQFSSDISSLAAGAYILRLETNDGPTSASLFAVVR